MILGIDPGANTGLAFFIGGKLLRLETTTPWGIAYALRNDISRVVFEDCRLQSNVWITGKVTRPVALNMARKIGQVDAWCSLIVALCAEQKITCHGISPKAKGEKLNAVQFAKLTGWIGKNNQHERDAAMVGWAYRGAK